MHAAVKLTAILVYCHYLYQLWAVCFHSRNSHAWYWWCDWTLNQLSFVIAVPGAESNISPRSAGWHVFYYEPPILQDRELGCGVAEACHTSSRSTDFDSKYHVVHSFSAIRAVINPLAYTAACEAAGLARSINAQPAVRRNSETNPTSQHNRGVYWSQ